MSFNTSYAVSCRYASLRVDMRVYKLFDYFSTTSMSHSVFAYRACEVRVFLTAVSDERNEIGVPYFPRRLRIGHSS